MYQFDIIGAPEPCVLYDEHKNVVGGLVIKLSDNMMAKYVVEFPNSKARGCFYPFGLIADYIFRFTVVIGGIRYNCTLTEIPRSVVDLIASIECLKKANMNILIDFTFSNVATEGFELHTTNIIETDTGEKRIVSQYQRAGATLLSIASNYDSDGKVDIYGFGFRHSKTLEYYGCDPLPGGNGSTVVSNIGDFTNMYFNAVTYLTRKGSEHFMAGPTVFSPYLRRMEEVCARDTSVYNIAVIFTDGIISEEEVEECKLAINSLCRYPISIILCKVGNGNFAALSALDGDVTAYAERDIVQSIFINDNIIENPMYFRKLIEEELYTHISQYVGTCK